MTDEPAPPLPKPAPQTRRGDRPPPIGSAFFRGGVALLALFALATLLWQLRPVLLLLFAATLVAIVLDGLTRAICRRIPLPRGVALGLSALLAASGIVAIVWLFGAELANQINHLAALVPGGWDDLSDIVGEQRLNGYVDRLAPSGSNIFSIVQAVLSFVSGMVSATLLAMLGGVFLAAQPATYQAGFRALLPQRWDAIAVETIHAIGLSLRRFMLGQAISVLFVGVTIFIGMWLVGAPSPLALAVIAGILGFIPVVGPLMAAVPGVLVGLTMGGDAFWKIAAIYFVVQQIDGNLVNALVMKRSVKIPPAVTMFSLFAIGVTFGPAGLLLGGPIAVLGFVLVRKLWIENHLGKTID